MKMQKILPFQNKSKIFSKSTEVTLFYTEDHSHVSTYQTRQFSTKVKHLGKKENKYQTQYGDKIKMSSYEILFKKNISDK